MYKHKKIMFTDRIPRVLLLISLVLMSASLWAANLTELYEAQVLVIGQDDKERKIAIRTAMEKVLTKVSGRRDVGYAPEVEQALSNAMQYVQQFRYIPLEELEKSSRDEQAQEKNGAAGADVPVEKIIEYTQLLRVNFDAKAVNQLMLGAGLPIWGHARPTTLLWLAIETQGERYIMGGDVNDDIKNELMKNAEDRGLPLMIPLLDLEDQVAVRFTDIWGNFKEVINNASLRYQSEASLVGRVYQQSNGLWGARWSLYQGENADHWMAADGQMTDVLAAGVDGATDRIALRFAQAFDETEQGVVLLAINGIDTVKDYARTMVYLQSLDAVTKLSVMELATSSLVFELSVRGGSDRLKQNIAFGQTLALEAQTQEGPGQNANNDKISYRLLP